MRGTWSKEVGGREAKGRLVSLVARYLRNEQNRRASESELQVGDAAADRERSFAVIFSHRKAEASS